MKIFAPVLFMLIYFFQPAYTAAQIKLMHETEQAEINKVILMKDEGIKRLCIYRFDIDEVDWQQDSSLVSDMKYDASSMNFTEVTTAPIYTKGVLILNSDNNILSREIFDAKNNLTGKTLYHYNQNAQLEKREIFLGNSKAFDEIYDYQDGALRQMKYITADSLLFSYSMFNTDQLGNVNEEIKYDSKDVVEYKYLYTYDAKSRCIKEEIILGDKISTIVDFKYSNDRLTGKITSDNNGKILSKVSYEYDGNGLLVSEINESPSLKINKTYQYKEGRILQIKVTDLSDSSNYLLKYFYE